MTDETSCGGEGGNLPAETDLSALERELSELRAYCARLEAIVSHEATAVGLLHDLRSVVMALGVLIDHGSSGAGPLGKAVQHAADLARELTTVGRNHGVPEARCEPNDILAAMQGMLEALVPGKLVLQLGNAVGAAEIAPLQLQRIVLNLVANAGEAIEGQGPTGEVRVRTERREGWVDLTVEDTGEGMPPDERTRLQKPTQTTKPDGLGLGLALVVRWVTGSGGSLEVASSDGSGTAFRLRLPAAD